MTGFWIVRKPFQSRSRIMEPMWGSNVVSLYPNLEIEKVVRNIKEAVMESGIKWEEADYQEGARYIALNWDKETCARSSLRRILPVRRGKRGTRPGMKGAGPRGKIHGDQEQWIFPPVKLKEDEKKEIIAEVVAIATKAMFKNHFYNFGGRIFHQSQGGPIGLRGKCAVARIVMQMFDSRWKEILRNNKIRTWEIMRYVDDSRAILPPIRCGWR